MLRSILLLEVVIGRRQNREAAPTFMCCVVQVLYQISRDPVCGNCCVEYRGCEGKRQYRTLISLLGFVSPHAPSGIPGFTAGRGFNPAGGAPGGG
ncbi:hypothetical protein F511_07856 [Dorcoceras hygrometricum]|uniref:Uncharacterized protein n=1 Tax=Dorcoceras hygrometricum TaxID=472368 RepID=A0A2Z7DHQ2_9LAMI|nr:hypothetical protein F511_07856 [Dorcoceras hygrometricum]